MNTNDEMTLLYGIAWREKLADEILAQWHALPLWRRVYHTLRGHRPPGRAELIASFD